jgi:hypothetical protein
LANGMKMLKGNGNTTTLLFSLKGLEILHQERRVQVKTIVNSILFHKSGPALITRMCVIVMGRWPGDKGGLNYVMV